MTIPPESNPKPETENDLGRIILLVDERNHDHDDDDDDDNEHYTVV